MLAHDAVRAPGGQGIVEAFVGSSDGALAGMRESRGVELAEIAHPVVGLCRNHPCLAAPGERIGEAGIVLEQNIRRGRQRLVECIPIDGVVGLDPERRHHGRTVESQVGGRGKILLLQVLHLLGERLLRRATGTGVPGNRAVIDHHGKGKAGVRLGFIHDHFRGLVDGITRAVPVQNDAVNSAADHVLNLFLDLDGIGGVVAHIHVVRLPEPQHHVSEDLGRSTGVKQRMNIHLADVGSTGIAVGLRCEAGGRAGVTRGLRRQGSCGNDFETAREAGHGKQQAHYSRCKTQ